MINLSDISMIDERTYKLTSKGNEITFVKKNGGWDVFLVNASVRAYRRGFATSKFFESIEAVEKHYKSLIGISCLINEMDTSKAITH
jgi:hypothetical protein